MLGGEFAFLVVNPVPGVVVSSAVTPIAPRWVLPCWAALSLTSMPESGVAGCDTAAARTEAASAGGVHAMATTDFASSAASCRSSLLMSELNTSQY